MSPLSRFTRRTATAFLLLSCLLMQWVEGREIAFIDAAVPDRGTLAEAFAGQCEVVLLQSDTDGLAQMASHLQGHRDITAIHVVSHGAEGSLRLGTLSLASSNLDAHARELLTVGQSLAQGGDLLVYGCDVAATSAGVAFIERLAELTGADVAASTDSTGGVLRGGNWKLERAVGEVTALSGLAEEKLARSTALLAGVAGTIDFNTTDGDLATTVTDGMGGSSDIPGIVYQIFTANADGSANGTTMGYYGDIGIGIDSLVGDLGSGDPALAGDPMLIIKSASGAEFSFEGIRTGNRDGIHSKVTFTGLRDGVSTGAVTLAVDYMVTGINSFTTTHLTPSIFQNVDEVRITNPDIPSGAPEEVVTLGIDLIVFGDPVLPPAPPVAGLGGALNFELSRSEGVQVSDNNALDFGTGSFTVEAWFKRASSTNGFYTIVGKQTGSGGTGFYLRFNTDKLSFATGTSGSANWVDGNAVITDTDWHHVAAVVDASAKSMTIFVDGVVDNATSFTTAKDVTNATQLGIGFKPNYGEYFDGALDEVRIWNTARSSSQIREYMHTPLAGTEAGLVGYWNFEEGLGTSAANRTATSGLNGTLQSPDGDEWITGNTGYSATWLEDTNLALRLGGSDADDQSSATAVITSLPANGDLYQTNDGSTLGTQITSTGTTVTDTGGNPRRVIYKPDANYTGADSFGYKVNDGTNDSANTVTVNLTVAAMTDIPTLTTIDTLSGATEDTAFTITFAALAAAADEADVDGDTLSFGVVAVSSGTLTKDDVEVTPGATFLSAGEELVWTPAANANGTLTAFTVKAWDGANASATAVAVQVNVTAVNDSPAVSGLPASFGLTEDSAYNPDFSAASFSDPDSASITVTLSASSGTFVYAADGNNPAAILTGITTSQITITGAPSTINTYLSTPTNITYTPAANANGTPAATLTVTANDGDGSGSVSLGSIDLNITAANDAPSVAAPASIAVMEDFETALTGISFSDADAGVGNVLATFTVASGALNATSGAGVSVGGTNSALTLSGTIADINSFIAASNLTFTPALNDTSDVTLGIEIDDGGNTGIGGTETATENVTLNITPIADAPTVAHGTTAEDTLSGALSITANIADGAGVTHFKITAITGGRLYKNDATTEIANSDFITSAEGAAGVKFIPLLDKNSSAGDTFKFDVSAALDASGTGLSAAQAVAITVTEINDAPSTSDDTLSDVAEDSGPWTIPFAALLANDSTGPANESVQTITIKTVASGTGGSVAIDGTDVIFTASEDFNGAAAFDYTIEDNGTTNGSADAKTSTGSVSFTVTAVNDSPTATHLTQSKSATEAGGAVALNDIVVTDPDAGDTITATLTLSSVSAGTLSTGTFGSATSTFNAGTGIWTVTGSASDVNAALAAVAFTPSSNYDQNFTVTTHIRDASDTGPADGTITFTVTGVNDAPTATHLTQTKLATEEGSAVALDDIVVTDLDLGDTITATLTLSNSTAGTLSTGTFGSATSTFNAGTGIWTVTGSVADVNAALAAVAFTPSPNNDQNFTINTRIRDAAATGPADGTISITVTAVNDAPTATNLTHSKAATEGGSAVALDDIVVTDPDTGDTITATLTLSSVGAGTLSTGTFGSATSTFDADTGVWTVTGSVADVNAALAAAAFTPSSNNDQDFTIATQIRDAADTGPADGAIAISVTAENDAPVVTSTGGTTAYTESSAAIVIDSGLTVTDADDTNLESATVAITANLQADEDTLVFTNQNGISGSYNSGTGVLTLTGTAAVVDYQTALRSVRYNNLSDTPTTTDRTITFVANDGDTDSAAATKTVSVAASNDPAVVTTSNGTTAFVEGNNVTSAPITVDASLTISDADNATLASATVSITANLQANEDRLAFTNDDATAYGNIDGSHDNLTGVLTLTSADASATLAQWQSALRAVTYRNISQTPNEATRTISFVVDDGSDPSVAATKAVSVAAVNDTPVLTVSAAAAYIENAAATVVLSGAGNSLGDADHANLAGATIVVAGGFADDGDVLSTDTTDTAITATWDGPTKTLALSGSDSKANYGAVLARVKFASSSDNPTNFGANTTRTITWQINDGAGTNNLSAAQTTTLTITAVNDAPTITGTSADQIVTDKTSVELFTAVTIGDVDHASIAVSIALDDAAKGTLSNLGTGTYDSAAGLYTIADTPAAVTAAIRALIFSPAENRVSPGTTETTTFTVEADDADADVVADNVTTVVSTSLNDVPTNLTLSSTTLNQSASANANIGTLTTTDVDTGETFTYTLVAGTGADDNAFFNVSGDKLRATAPATLAPRNYSVRVQTRDASDAIFEKAFTIAVSDNVAATIQTVAGPAAGTYGVGQSLDFTFTFSEVVTVDTSGGTPFLEFALGGEARAAIYVSGSGTTTLVFRYVVQPGDYAAGGEVVPVQLDLDGGTIQDASGNKASLTFTPPTLDDVQVEASFHSADTDQNWRLSLLELTRVIELYNTRDGTIRTGAYHGDPTTEDGFAAGPGIITSHHSADTNQDGRLSLLELTRVIELYNTRDGTVRTGAYHRAATETEDGFAPGEATP